jgi:hypothetical protein
MKNVKCKLMKKKEVGEESDDKVADREEEEDVDKE